ncbi:MAG TPA: DUF4430 domain-containing protein [Gaiellaceae bacterium]|nr:DUF4430 domain-containing protein [Gaiellaceae bacterium]
MLRRLALLLAGACLLAGCGEEAAGEGSARLWITRDRGSEVVLATTVPAGISALEALRREAEVETRYGGRFVQAIDGLEGDIAEQRDWFFFVNGYEADISAADYELHDGDVLWWDHRSWSGRMREPVVVGAFPEPFLHGWDGERRRVVVEGGPASLEEELVKLVGGRSPGGASGVNRLVLVAGSGFRGTLEGGPGDPVVFRLGRETARRLLENPAFARYRYELP